jgi:hypothetical protein
VTTWDVFRHAERVETVAAAIYGSLARQFADDDGARALFARLEQEELQHASRVRLLASRYRADTKLMAKPSGATAMIELVQVVEGALAEVNAGSWGRDLAAVERRLVALEGALQRAHAQAIAEDAHPALRDFFRQLSLQDDAHVALLGRS